MVELPTGTVTFVFTDIEGSTRLWEEYPDAMQESLARHDEILRMAIDTHDGVIVKTTGDGVHAAFATAAGGVAAAIDAQCAMTSASWDDVGGLKIRIGVHTGEAEIRDGDYYGSALNRAARLMSVAHGGQIVLSHVTEELARDALAPDVELVDLGEHRLRDLASPMRVLQIVHPALARDFPRLRSLDAQSSNLPLQVTSFVGRDEDVATLAAELADAPLVTLTGTGGVGKTRLAIQVAAEIVPRFPDGAWFCELAAAADGELMAEVVANTLGCVQRPGLTLADSIVEYLKVRQTLVVLDNCEHVLDAAGALAESVLRTCPGTKILATSREALEISGERVLRVRSLPAPDPATGTTALLESAAVQLFFDRAADAGARGLWDDAQMAAAGEICRRVDGIPLAIELAAARVAAMTPSEIAADLDERFRLLTGSRRGRVERHQTLRATVEWSYQLLDPVERTVFDRLGVFAGSFEAAGVVAVACDDDLDRWQAVDAVASLVAKSMLVAEEGPGGTTRYAMLETLRQFSRDQLDQSGEADAWRRRWAQHYAEFAESAGDGFKGDDDELWAQRIYAELDNVRAAISWGLDTGEPADGMLAVRMLVGLADFSQENRATAVMARAADAIAIAGDAPPELRSPALGLAAYHEMNQGNPHVARSIAQDALRDGVVLTSLHPFLASMNLAFIEMLTGNHDSGLAVMNDARRSLSEVDAYTEARLLATVAAYEGLAGNAAQARADAERAMELAQPLQNRTVRALGWHGLAWALTRDEPEAALRAIEHYLELLGGITTNGIAGAALGLMGGLRGRLGDPVGAVEALRGGVIASRDEGARPQVAAALEWSISVLTRVGRTDAAAVCMGALTTGSLAEVSNYPSAFSGARARALEHLRTALGDAATTQLVDQGAAMTYDEIVQYAIDHLEPVDAWLPTGTVTFLFTDVEGSTRLWEELPDAMPECLARHDEILRGAIDTHDGVIVKTTGDGVHAAFSSAADGVAAAIDAQLAISRASWDAVGGLRVRMGVHTGEAEIRDGDYYGSALNRAARLMSVAHGDQIVVSHVTEDLARDSLSGGIELLDLGEHRLRDLASPMHVFQIVHPDLPREFPRLRSLETYSGNLPSQLTSFVGRDEEIVALAAALEEAPLVTLTGTGGVGKTRLAAQVAAEVVPRFADGAWLCELATADDGELMVQVVASTIGCTQRPGLSLAESIVEYLTVRSLLLVLDNCEHLLDDVGDLAAQILGRCPAVKLLATSREALEVTGERVVRLRSLAAPAPDTAPAELQGSTAVRLFADRARDAGAVGTWTDEQWRTIAEICRRVDGIPLAIELAAARVASMSPAEIAGHLDERFRLLTGKRRGRVERQQTLRATVDWSYQLLDDDDRVVFDRLGVFAGTFDAEGAAAVVSDETLDTWRVIDSIASLVAKSMLVPEDGPAASTRYSMLETLRLFSREQLDQTDDADRWRRRHAEHFAEFAEAAGAGMQGEDDSLWRERTFADLDNLRATMAWGLDRDDRGDSAFAVRTIVALANFGQEHQTTSVAALALRAVPLVDDGPPVWRATVYGLASYHEMNVGNGARARELAEVAIRDGVLVPSLHPYFPYQNLMFVELITGRYDRVQELLGDVRRAFDEVDHPFGEAHLRSTMAIYQAMLGRFADARVDAERALELARTLRNQTVLLASLHGLAWALQRDEPEAALRVIEEYLALVRDQPTTGISGSAFALAGRLRARLRDPFGALRDLQAGLVITRDQGVRPQLAAVLEWGLSVLSHVGRPEAAARFYGALTSGALAIVSNYPLPTANARTRVIERLTATLGAAEVERLIAEGAAMPYDELVAYAVEQLAPVEPEPTG